MKFVVPSGVGTLLLVFVLRSALGGDHHTLRFLYPDSRAAKSVCCMAMSPDGKELALCVEPGTVHFIGTADGEQISQMTGRPFAMSYSRDGSRILMVSTDDAWIVDTKTRRRVSVDTREPPGYIGLKTVERNGKLLIDTLIKGGPAAESGQLSIGDEIVAFGEGKLSEFRSAIGLSVSDFVTQIKGPVRTFIRIQVLRKGQPQPEPVVLQRSAAKFAGDSLVFGHSEVPPIKDNLVRFQQRDGRHTFVSSFDGSAIGSVATENLEYRGQHAISPDQHWFATLSFVKDNRRKYGIEVFDLTKLERTLFFPFERRSFVALSFTADGTELLAGSRDRIDVFDVASGKFSHSYRLDGAVTTVFDDDHPKKNPVRFDGSIGNSVAGARADDVGAIYEAPAHKVQSIAASQRLLAIAAPWGQVDLLDLTTGGSVKSFPFRSDDKYAECNVQVMEFSTDGRWLVFYVNGVLNIVNVADIKPTVPRD